MHEVGPTSSGYENAPSSVSEMLSSSWASFTSGVSDAVDTVEGKISGGYSWIKGEVKGAADYTVDKTTSLLWTVAIAGTVVFILFIVLRKEIAK